VGPVSLCSLHRDSSISATRKFSSDTALTLMCGVRRDRRRGESYEWILHRAETSSSAFRVLPSSMFVGCVVAVGCFWPAVSHRLWELWTIPRKRSTSVRLPVRLPGLPLMRSGSKPCRLRSLNKELHVILQASLHRPNSNSGVLGHFCDPTWLHAVNLCSLHRCASEDTAITLHHRAQ